MLKTNSKPFNIRFLLSNSFQKDGRLTIVRRKHFDFFAQFAETQKAVPLLVRGENGHFAVWLAGSSTNTESESRISNRFSESLTSFEDSFNFKARHGGRKGILFSCHFMRETA